MEAPAAVICSAEDVCTATVGNDTTVSTSVGTPMESVSLRAGSCRSMWKRRWMSCRLMEGSCTSTCTSTPSGLPMASASTASDSLVGTSSA